MPQLTTVDVRGQKENGKGERGKEGEEKEQDGTERVQRWSWKRLHWQHWPRWLRCLAPVGALWLVLQEEAPLHPSASPLETGGRLLLAGLLWTSLGLCFSLLQFIYHYRVTHKQENRVVSQNHKNSELAVRGTKQVQQAWQQDSGHLVAMVSALLDAMVVSLLEEPPSDSNLPQIRSLLTRLENLNLPAGYTYSAVPVTVIPPFSFHQAVSQAVNKGILPECQLLQDRHDEGRVCEEESSLIDKIKHLSTYLQDRVSALHSLLQVQDSYGVCVADAQQSLQEFWEQLENLHTRVTLQPEKCQVLEDPHVVLSDTENLYTQLGLFKSKVHDCQTHLNKSTQLLQELDNRQQVLADTVGVLLKSSWNKDFLECNTQKFEKVYKDFMSLEQQTLTFVTHLRGLRGSEQESEVSVSDLEQVQNAPSLPLSTVPVLSVALATENPVLDTDSEPPPKSSSKLSAMNCLRGVRRKR
ncbi:hypothetical protein NFI96_020273 [Prochilodus magdalenae]|nr:hypothetical protein NFI96_020273 [Prochilodus magdalenae]